MWIIRDGNRYISTGCSEHERAKAEIALAAYIANERPREQFFIYFLTAKAVLPTDDPILERRIHRQFRHLRLRGEWFERAPELMGSVSFQTETLPTNDLH